MNKNKSLLATLLGCWAREEGEGKLRSACWFSGPALCLNQAHSTRQPMVLFPLHMRLCRVSSERGRERAPGAQIPGYRAAGPSWRCRPEPWPGPALEPVTVDEVKPLLGLPLAGRSSTLFYFAELPVNVPNRVT